MPTNRAMELLYDSEATLRLVDHELEALRDFDASGADAASPSDPAGIMEDGTPTSALALVPQILERANAEIINVLGSLRQCRSAIEHATSDKLQITHEKIREVTTATETAATDILDGLDRAQSLIDELDAEAESAGDVSEKAKDIRGRLRDEIFSMTGCLQFQDITTQQLTYASSVLVEMESRLGEIARLFDPRRYGAPELPPETVVVPETYSPDAAFDRDASRQAMADQIFTPGS